MTDDPSELDDLIMRDALGEALSPAERAQLKAALARDPALCAEASSLEQTLVLLAASVSESPPPGLRERVLAAASPPSRKAGRWLQALAAGLAVIALIGGGWLATDNQRLRREVEQQDAAARMLLEPNVVLSFALSGRGSQRSARGIVLLDLDSKRASISVRGLADPPPGQTYKLWAELDGKRVPCGEFAMLDNGTLLTQFAIPVDSYTSPIVRLVMTTSAGETVMTSG